MSKKTESFDANLAVVPGDFRHLERSRVFIQNSAKWRSLTADEHLFLSVLSRWEGVPQDSGGLPRLLSGAEFASEFPDVVKEVKPEFSRLVTDGRLRLTYILNSSKFEERGNLHSHLDLIGSIQRRGGKVAVLGGKQVGNASAELFMHADRQSRYLMPDSQLTFSLLPGENPDHMLYRDRRIARLTYLRETLLPQLGEGFRDEVAKLLDGASTSIDFTAREASQAGLCKLTKGRFSAFERMTDIRPGHWEASLRSKVQSLIRDPQYEEIRECSRDDYLPDFGPERRLNCLQALGHIMAKWVNVRVSGMKR
jgi:hypothetical protein